MIQSKMLLMILSLIFMITLVHTDKVPDLAFAPNPSPNRTLEFYQFVDQQNYYYYEFYVTSQGRIQIQILNSDSTRQQLKFSSKYPLFLRAQYYNFIIVEEMNGNLSVTYWVLEIVSTSKSHQLLYFSVSSNFDYYNFNFNNSYLLTSIIQYDQTNEILYVTLRTENYTSDANGNPGNFDVYAIDVKHKSNKLLTVNWFYFNQANPQRIVGGNSRVLVEASNDQFWFAKGNVININTAPTYYDIVNISSLTNLTIYPGGSLAYILVGSFFQYVSASADFKKISTFVFRGYSNDKKAVSGQYHLQSTNPIRIFTDRYSFFVAVSNDDVYSTIMLWDSVAKMHVAWSRSFKNTINDNTVRAQYISEFLSALLIQQHDGRLFVLTPTTFSVYNVLRVYHVNFSKTISQSDNLQELMILYMRQYYRSLTIHS